MHMGVDLAALLIWRLKEVLLTDATQLSLDEARKLSSPVVAEKRRELPLWCSSSRVRQTWHPR